MKFSIAAILSFLSLSAAAPLAYNPAPANVLPFQLNTHYNYPHISKLSHLKARGLNNIDDNSTISTSLDDRIIAYTIDLGFGEPTQYYSMILDTGSSELWIGNSTSITAKPYDYNADTAKKMSNIINYLVYGIGEVALRWGSTTLTLGDASDTQTVIADAPFSIAFQTAELDTFSQVSGLVGLAYSENGHTNLPQLLKNKNLIDSVSYSLYLNTNNATGASSSILFGGVDHSKYTGQLTSIPRVDIPGTTHKYLAVNLTAISFPNNSNIPSPEPVNWPVLLDSGTTYTYLPTDTYLSILSYLGVDPAITEEYGEVMLDTETFGDYELEFQFQGSASFRVKARDLTIPLSTFNLNEVSASETVPANFERVHIDDEAFDSEPFDSSPASSADASKETLIPTPTYTASATETPTAPTYDANSRYLPLGLADSGNTKSSVMIIGERALQAAYVVFDLDGERIAIAQAANYGSDDSVASVARYEAITAAGIPGAVVVN